MEVIDKIRDILRTEGIASRKSFNYCVAFIIIRLFDKKICQKLNIEFTFDELCNLDKDRLYENMCKLIPYLVYNLNMNFLRNFKLSPDNLYKIFTLLRTLNPCELNEKYDLIGTLYELHIKTGSNNGRDLGQFFTNRLVIEYMINLVDPQLNETICDPTMGTGGFLTMAVKYLNKYDINWSVYKNLIFGYDIDQDVKDLAFLNLFLETGEKFGTLYQQDVLSQGLKHKYKIILANEPMGVKSSYNSCCENIKQLCIKTNKCESLFLQLFCQHLEENGRCCIIVPNGFLYSLFHQKTREYIINNFNLQKVISLNGDFFINTNVKTSIMYFINDGKTTNIEFLELNSDFKENHILNINIKNLDNNYTLLYSYYLNKTYKTNFLLSDLFSIFIGTFNSSSIDNKGIYPFYCGKANNPIGTHSTYNMDYPEYLLLIKGGGSGKNKYGDNIGLGKSFYVKGKTACSNGVFALIPKNNLNVNVKFIYYYLNFIKNYIMDLANYTVGLGNIKKSDVEKINIPILSPDVQHKIVKSLDLMTTTNDKIKNVIKLYQKQIKYLININMVNKTKLYNLCDLKRGKSYKSCTKNGHRLIKISNIKNGKVVFLDKDDYIDKVDDKYILNKNDFIVALVGSCAGKIGIYNENEKVIFSSSVAKFTKFNNVLPKYLYYYLRQKENLIRSKAHGTCQPNVMPSSILSLNVPVISEVEQEKLILYCDKITTLIDNLDINIKINEGKKKLIMKKELNIDI